MPIQLGFDNASYIVLFFATIVFYSVVYVVISGFFYGLFGCYKQQAWSHRKSQHKPIKNGQITREVLTTFRSLIVFSVMTVLGWWFMSQGWSQMYLNLDDHSIWWFIASFLIYFYVHDAWFYWTHRMMHHKLFFRWMHKEHHQSVNPTPWACYSFSLAEAFVQGIIFLILVVIIPIHPLALILVLINLQLFNALGHLGYEFSPRWWTNSWLSDFYNTPTHHNMHHQYSKGNYGLYLNLWDRIMNTNLTNYREKLTEASKVPLLKPKARQDA